MGCRNDSEQNDLEVWKILFSNTPVPFCRLVGSDNLFTVELH